MNMRYHLGEEVEKEYFELSLYLLQLQQSANLVQEAPLPGARA